MKVPLAWLRELVAFEVSAAELAERLTFAGLEVEAVEKPMANLDRVVAVEVAQIRPHPNAERLRICAVTDGAGTFEIVCGASNFKIGDRVPLALPDAVLADGTCVKPAMIRGVQSCGMLCAPDELGVSLDHDGLMILPPDTPLGRPLAEILGAAGETLVIEVTPNRPDCLSILGIAREVAALYGLPLQRPNANPPEDLPRSAGDLAVSVEQPLDCPRYVAWCFDEAEVRPAPYWMQRRLFQAGIRPINNVVDITNYVMLECGQPLHAFDRTLLRGGQIHVRRARPGEQLVTLDGVKRELTGEMLVIADAERPVALAGIMGGEESGIMSSTRAIVLESACFHAPLIRRTSRALGLSSESSMRFERGIDVQTTAWAARRAAVLLRQYANARAIAAPIDVFAGEPPPRTISCRFDRVRSLLGLDLAEEQMTRIFEALEMKIVGRSAETCTVQVPSFRLDLEGEADLSEEVARIHGLQHIPVQPARRNHAAAAATHTRALAVIRVREILRGMGLVEIMNYSFVSERLLNIFDPASIRYAVRLPNPVSAEQSHLRPALLPQMVETLGANRAHQIQHAACFEVGRIFLAEENQPAREEETIAIGLMGACGRPPLDQRRAVEPEEAFCWLKGILENLVHILKFSSNHADGSGGLALLPFNEASPHFQRPGRAAFMDGAGMVVLLDGEPAGYAGLIRPAWAREWRIFEPLAVAELSVDPLLKHFAESRNVKPVPVYPAVRRDLALRVPQDARHAAIMQVMHKLAPPELTDVRLFDIFTGRQIGAGYKSMAYALTYRAEGRTLTDEEVNALHARIIAGLQAELQVEVRAG